ncbi:AAA family ATPase [Candidatus Micrarchaeota archaeon]|nr:AAA family ATPase [Candidatus Micrarchaeota archaeon]
MANVFEQELSKNTVFLDRNALSQSYIPDHLPHREAEIERMMRCLAPALQQKTVNNLFLYGKTGVGKTSCTKHVIEKLLETKQKHNVPVDGVYINCAINNSKYQVMLKVAEYCCPGENLVGFPFAALFEKILNYASSKNSNMVIVLDEIDKVNNLDDLMYALTRANDELKSGHVSIIGITNNALFKDELDPRSKSTLCEEEMVFPPYNASQLQSILEERIRIGFKPGSVDESAINLAAALSAQESGDARYALKLIVKAAEMTDAQGAAKILDKHVVTARKSVEEDIVFDVIKTLPEHQKIVLRAIASLTSEGSKVRRLGEERGELVLFSGEVFEQYEKECRKMEKSPRSARWCREYIRDLEMLGLVTTTLSGKGVRGNTTLIKLTFPPDKVMLALQREN